MSLLKQLSKFAGKGGGQKLFDKGTTAFKGRLNTRTRRRLGVLMGRHGDTIAKAGNWAWENSGASNIAALDWVKNWAVGNFQRQRAEQLQKQQQAEQTFTKTERNEIAHERAMRSANRDIQVEKSRLDTGGEVPKQLLDDVRIIRDLTEKNANQGSGILSTLMGFLGDKGFGGLTKILGGVKGILGKGLGKIGGKVAGSAVGLAATKAATSVMPKAATAGIKGASGLLKGGLSAGKGILGKGLGKVAGSALLKGGGKTLAKKIPAIGALAGLGFGAQRALAGDFKGAGLEVLSGALGAFAPGPGTAASLAIDAGLIARDIQKAKEAGLEAPETAYNAFSDGSIGVGSQNEENTLKTPINSPEGHSLKKVNEQSLTSRLSTSSGLSDLINAALDRKRGIFVTLSSDNEALAEALSGLTAQGGFSRSKPDLEQTGGKDPSFTPKAATSGRMGGMNERTYNQNARGELSKATVKDLTIPEAGNWKLGQTSKRYESGKGGAGTVSSGKGDFGGVSYGTYQLASRQGRVQEFLKAYPEYGQQFAGMAPATPQFNAKWKEIASKDKNFGNAQHDYIKRTHYDPQMRKLQKDGIDLSKRGAAVHDAVWSTSVQFGPGGSIVSKALKDKDLSKMSDADIINSIQDYKASNNDRLFKSSSSAVKAGTLRRAEDERKSLLALDRTTKATKFQTETSIPDYAKSIKQKSYEVDAVKEEGQKPVIVPMPMPNAATTQTPRAGSSGPNTVGAASHMLTRNNDTSIRRLTDAKMSYSMV